IKTARRLFQGGYEQIGVSRELMQYAHTVRLKRDQFVKSIRLNAVGKEGDDGFAGPRLVKKRRIDHVNGDNGQLLVGVTPLGLVGELRRRVRNALHRVRVAFYLIEARYFLLFAIFEDLKVFLLQCRDWLSILVEHHDWHEDVLCPGGEFQ